MSTGNPQRIQRKRTKGWRMPENTVYVGRGSRWGNPHRVGDIIHDRIEEHRTWEKRAITATNANAMFAEDMRPRHAEIRAHLVGKNLACWCALDQPCHADVLLEIANADQ